MIQRVVKPIDEKPDHVRSSVVGAHVYEAYLRLKKSAPELTQREAADKLGLNLIQLKNALTRQRRRRGVMKPHRKGQYCDW